MGRGGGGGASAHKNRSGGGARGPPLAPPFASPPGPDRPGGAPLFSPRSSNAQALQPSVVYFLLLTMAATELFYGILVLPANLPRSGLLGMIGLSF